MQAMFSWFLQLIHWSDLLHKVPSGILFLFGGNDVLRMLEWDVLFNRSVIMLYL